MKKLIAFAGISHSGKDTAADFLCEQLRDRGHRVVRDAFAYPLKRFARDVFEWSPDRLWGPSERRNDPDPTYGWYVGAGDWHIAAENFAQHVFAFAHELADAAGCTSLYALGALYRWFADLLHHVAETQECLTARHALQTLGTEMGRSLHEDVWVRMAFERARRRDEGVVTIITDARFDNEFRAVREDGELWHIYGRGGLEGEAGQHASERDLVGPELPRLRTAAIDNGGSLDDLRMTITDLVKERFS